MNVLGKTCIKCRLLVLQHARYPVVLKLVVTSFYHFSRQLRGNLPHGLVRNDTLQGKAVAGEQGLSQGAWIVRVPQEPCVEGRIGIGFFPGLHMIKRTITGIDDIGVAVLQCGEHPVRL